MGIHCLRQGERLLVFSEKNLTHLSLPSRNNLNSFLKKHTRHNNALLQNNFKNPHPNQTGLVGLFYLWKAFALSTFSIKTVFNLKLEKNQSTNQSNTKTFPKYKKPELFLSEIFYNRTTWKKIVAPYHIIQLSKGQSRGA